MNRTQDTVQDDKTASQPRAVPNTDMQADDAGTAESGNGSKGMASESAMKQTSKTPAERSGGEQAGQ